MEWGKKMPKRICLEIESIPYQYKGKKLTLKKCITHPDFQSSTVLTDDAFTYVQFFFQKNRKALKYKDPASKAKYGDPNKYHYSFYWDQALIFYKAAKTLPIESMPLLSYYSMLNATKAYLAFKSEYIEDFVEHFSGHGLFEDKSASGEGLEEIKVFRKQNGVFVLFGKTLDNDFDMKWPNGKSNAISLRKLLYNLVYVHRAYTTTYATSKRISEPELFIPLKTGTMPTYYKGNDSKLYLKFELDKSFFPSNAVNIPTAMLDSIKNDFSVYASENNFVLRSKDGGKRNQDSLSAEFKELNRKLRSDFQYIRSNNRLWYIKRKISTNQNEIDLNDMLITMAAMHRISEIVRYKPEQMGNIMKSKENWLIHEFLTLSLDQFIDEIAAEITGQEIMGVATKN